LGTARILNNLANYYYQQDKLQGFCTFCGWAADSAEGALGKKDPLLAASLADHAGVLRSIEFSPGRLLVAACNVVVRFQGRLFH